MVRVGGFILAAVRYLIGGEEVPWGQRILHFRTPEFLMEINLQGETTIHSFGAFQCTPFHMIAGIGMLVPAVAALFPRLLGPLAALEPEPLRPLRAASPLPAPVALVAWGSTCAFRARMSGVTPRALREFPAAGFLPGLWGSPTISRRRD